jgi:hypothetical protein
MLTYKRYKKPLHSPLNPHRPQVLRRSHKSPQFHASSRHLTQR